jgi:hypothetical protein
MLIQRSHDQSEKTLLIHHHHYLLDLGKETIRQDGATDIGPEHMQRCLSSRRRVRQKTRLKLGNFQRRLS